MAGFFCFFSFLSWSGFLVLVVFLKTEEDSAGYVAFIFVHCIIVLLHYAARPYCFSWNKDDPSKRVFATAEPEAQASFHPLPLSLSLSFSDTSFRFRFALCHLSLSVSYLLSLLLFHTFIELGFTVPLSLRLPPSRSLFSCLSLSLLNKLPLMIVVKQTFLNNAWHLYRLVTFSLCAFEAQRIHFWRKTRKALCK